MQFSPEQIERLKVTSLESGLGDCTRLIVFNANCDIFYSTFPVENPQELQSLVLALGPREEAIKRGMILQRQRYEVHRHHPPLVWGRMHSTDPDRNTGIAVCETSARFSSRNLYAAITYELPHVSARMVDLLRTWCQKELTALTSAPVQAGA